MKNFVEIHVLQNFAPSNLNRDDTGAPKDAFFGGSRRARISSQCIKHAVREYFKTKKELLDANAIASRTKRVQDELIKSLKEKGRDGKEALVKIQIALKSVSLVIKDDGKTEYLLFLGKEEISKLSELINEHWDKIIPPENNNESAGKKKKKKAKEADAIPDEIRPAIKKVFDGGKAVDIALFGRMLADMPEKNQYASSQVAHAISTHAVTREFDFYTALDDLKPEESSGSDMMGTVEFNSACFYKYAVVDYEKLIENLQKDKELAEKGCRAFLEGFIVAEPSGKQNSFAAHNPPEVIIISVRKEGSPRNLANAFEVPVKVKGSESLTLESVKKLADKEKQLSSIYGSAGKSFYIDSADSGVLHGERKNSLTELLDAVMKTLTEEG